MEQYLQNSSRTTNSGANNNSTNTTRPTKTLQQIGSSSSPVDPNRTWPKVSSHRSGIRSCFELSSSTSTNVPIVPLSDDRTTANISSSAQTEINYPILNSSSRSARASVPNPLLDLNLLSLDLNLSSTVDAQDLLNTPVSSSHSQSNNATPVDDSQLFLTATELGLEDLQFLEDDDKLASNSETSWSMSSSMISNESESSANTLSEVFDSLSRFSEVCLASVEALTSPAVQSSSNLNTPTAQSVGNFGDQFYSASFCTNNDYKTGTTGIPSTTTSTERPRLLPLTTSSSDSRLAFFASSKFEDAGANLPSTSKQQPSVTGASGGSSSNIWGRQEYHNSGRFDLQLESSLEFGMREPAGKKGDSNSKYTSERLPHRHQRTNVLSEFDARTGKMSDTGLGSTQPQRSGRLSSAELFMVTPTNDDVNVDVGFGLEVMAMEFHNERMRQEGTSSRGPQGCQDVTSETTTTSPAFLMRLGREHRNSIVSSVAVLETELGIPPAVPGMDWRERCMELEVALQRFGDQAARVRFLLRDKVSTKCFLIY